MSTHSVSIMEFVNKITGLFPRPFSFNHVFIGKNGDKETGAFLPKSGATFTVCSVSHYWSREQENE